MASSSDRKLANAVGGKSARACDNCVKKRARWYCTADDAFLCQSCDSTVHSANSLARRHERIRLKTASMKLDTEIPSNTSSSWHQGFTRKARTPRAKKHGKLSSMNNPLHLVPELDLSYEEEDHENNEEQLLYQVPVFDPFIAELRSTTSANSNKDINKVEDAAVIEHGFGHEMNNYNLHGFIPSDIDLVEFAADVESLLGKGLEDESFDMEGLGLLDCIDHENEEEGCFWMDRSVKAEDYEEAPNNADLIDISRETFELNFDYDSPVIGYHENEEDVKGQNGETTTMMTDNFEGCSNIIENSKKHMFLRLDYEGVLSSWDAQKSPWTNGERPDLDCLDACGTTHVYGDIGKLSSASVAMVDGDREARVSRYREKRRTRLFSKKIRYQVRKLNAEKRPRMKGRFVKRANLMAPTTTFPLPNM